MPFFQRKSVLIQPIICVSKCREWQRQWFCRSWHLFWLEIEKRQPNESTYNVLFQSRIMIAKKQTKINLVLPSAVLFMLPLPFIPYFSFALNFYLKKKNFLCVKNWIAFNFAPSLFLTRFSFKFHVQNRWNRGKNRGNDSYEMDNCLVVQAFWWSNALNRDVYVIYRCKFNGKLKEKTTTTENVNQQTNKTVVWHAN